jgi:hypothetical protein
MLCAALNIPCDNSTLSGGQVQDLAASFAAVIETILSRSLKYLRQQTGLPLVHIACGEVRAWADLERIAAEAGFSRCRTHRAGYAAAGAALFAWHACLGRTGNTLAESAAVPGMVP